MKRLADFFILFLIGIFFLVSVTACKEKGISPSELAVGNWIQSENRAHILWVINPKGEWAFSVKIFDVTGKIVKSIRSAKGIWQIEEDQMIVTVMESDVEEVWEKNATIFFDIIELTETVMQLKEESGPIAVWKKTNTKKTENAERLNDIIPMGPIAVNLDKHRSHDKDRYLCLNMNLMLNEMMQGQEIPRIHPKAREAAVIFFSSLVFDDVKDFTSLEKQNKKLVAVLNPYMEGLIKEIKIEHVIVTADADQVEAFIIEHSIVEGPPGEDDQKTEESNKESE